MVSAKRALVSSRPRTGWKYSHVLNGITMEEEGVSPVTVLAAVRKKYQLNNAEFCEDDFWLQANLQWMNGSNPRNHIVPIGVVLDAIAAVQPEKTESERITGWHKSGLAHVAFTLVSERFDLRDLIAAMRLYERCCDPLLNPATGDGKSLNAVARAGLELRKSPPPNRAEARKWFFKFYNSEMTRLEQPRISYHKFSETNHWI